MNKLVRGNLVRGLPSKIFENDHSCIACRKGKQHKASCKAKLVNSINKPLPMLHMDLFGPINVKSLMKKSYCLVVTDDFRRFSYVFFLAIKDETSGILKTFITEIENQLDYKVKVIRSDNGTEFKNSIMNQFCEMKIIKREFSVARTPQQNDVAERMNRTLIEAARTMLVDSKLPTTFWVKAVNTASYMLNRVLVIKPHTKTPYELIRGRTPLIDFMKPFGCPVTILNTRDHLGKFDGKADEGLFVGYSVVSKAMRVFNKRTRIVEETLNIRFLENTPNVIGNGPNWLFDVNSLTISMNYVPVVTGNQTNGIAGTRDNIVAGQAEKKTEHLNKWSFDKERRYEQDHKEINAAEASNAFEDHLFERFSPFKNAFALPHVPNVFSINDTGIFGNAYDDEDVGVEADLNNLETTINVSPIPTTRIHKDHPKDQIIRDLNSAIQTRRMTKISDEHAMEPKKVIQALEDPRWIEAMQEELLPFELQKVFINKKDERGIVVRNKASLVAQGYTQEEGIDYDEVFAPVARLEAIRLFLAYASFMGFIVYQMDVKSAFLYGTIEEELYVCLPPGFEDPYFPDKVYKVFVDDIILGPQRCSFVDEFKGLMHKRFQISSMRELTFFLGLQVQQKEDGIFISQDKYVAEILKNFDFTTVKTASTLIETNKALVKDEEPVDVHLYRSMIGSLMYLTTSRPDIMFAVCACARNSPFDLEAFSDSDYARASLDRKSTTGGCQFLGRRLISWQCKKQTIVANSTTEAEYVAAANCCGQNPVFHSKTKHIEIRHHFIRNSYEKKLIQVIKIHIDHNVADLLTKAFDVIKFNFLIASIGLLNL
ncbi:putative ribonuclease H-like domain-containing protein [Tanacetum coccineum]